MIRPMLIGATKGELNLLKVMKYLTNIKKYTNRIDRLMCDVRIQNTDQKIISDRKCNFLRWIW